MTKKKLLIITTVSDSLPFFEGQINILKKSFDIELVSSPGAHLHRMCSKYQVRGHKISMKREISFINDIQSLFNLLVLFFKVKPDIIHGNTPKASLLSMIAGWLTRVPIRIYYIHGLRYQGEAKFKRIMLIAMEKLTCFFATNLIAVSRGIKETLINDQISNKKAVVIWNGSVNGIDLDYFNPEITDSISVRHANGIIEKNFVFGFVGRLVKDKGINELVAAFKKLNQLNNNIKLLLVGSMEQNLDPLKAETLKEIELNENIIYAGVQKDVRPFFIAMDLFVFPSYREGFGLVLMEAGAMKLPVISSDIIGCNEIVENGKNGFLIKSKNENVLYDKMNYCLNNQKKLSAMADGSRDMVTEKYEQNRLWEKTLDFYKKISNI